MLELWLMVGDAVTLRSFLQFLAAALGTHWFLGATNQQFAISFTSDTMIFIQRHGSFSCVKLVCFIIVNHSSDL